MVPFGFAQMAPVVEVNRAYNLISSACKQSHSLGGEMMIEFTEACSFTFYRALRKYSHHFQWREAQLSWKLIVKEKKGKNIWEKHNKIQSHYIFLLIPICYLIIIFNMIWKCRNQEKKRTDNIFFHLFQNELTSFGQQVHVDKYVSGDQGLIHPKLNLFALKIPASACCSSLGELTGQIMCFLYFSAKGVNLTAY